MTSPEDAEPVKPPPSLSSFSPDATVVIPKTRPADNDDLKSNISSPSFRTASSPPLSTPLSSLAQERISRSQSPTGRRSLSRLGTRSTAGSVLGSFGEVPDDTRSLIVRAFSPAIAVFSSSELDDLARQKGFHNGFRGLLRPFGERIPGKVVVRDSHGASRTWEDFGVRFIDLWDPSTQATAAKANTTSPFHEIEELLRIYLESSEQTAEQPQHINGYRQSDLNMSFPVYTAFLRRLLCAAKISPHETFLHPVSSVMAVHASDPDPVDTLRNMYTHTSQGSRSLPHWVHPEYLRYYVLVHDDDNDDFSRSTHFFDQMKRHFGLHCHLLRIRSSQALPTDDDSVEAETSEWLSPQEELSKLSEDGNLIDVEPSQSYLFGSDVTALRSLVRELVQQSVVPHMESKIAIWNDQVVSRRKGISGRFMSMSKRLAGFGSGSKGSSNPVMNLGGGSSGNYDALQGFYRFDSPEALMRKMADYSMMLRDFRLASTTYELLRSDYLNDKAWKYQAGANEMCVISSLLNPLATAAKMKVDNLDQMLETATYSYLSRCADPLDTLRCIAVSVELLRVRGKSAAESAAKWATRILELGIVGPVGHVLISERIGACFAAEIGLGSSGWGTRKRKAALWYVLAANEWLQLGKGEQASSCISVADSHYGKSLVAEPLGPFSEMQEFLDQLRLAVRVSTADMEDELPTTDGVSGIMEETSEMLDYRSHARHRSIATDTMGPVPLSPLRTTREEPMARDDDFE
ncbi:MAG: hypothetical protein Q9227_005533 [Pyrenula ochraceoflavens]